MLDVFSLGEAMVRFSVAPGGRLQTANSFTATIAGSEFNVLTLLARLGRATRWWSYVPDSPLGHRVKAELQLAGVHTQDVVQLPESRLGAFYVELNDPPLRTRIYYDRARTAACRLASHRIPWSSVRAARWIHMSGITPAISRSAADACHAVADFARANSVPLSVDVNYRSHLWPAPDACETITRLATDCSLIVCSKEDAEDVFGIDGPPEGVIDGLIERTRARACVVTMGSEGVVWSDGTKPTFAPAADTVVRDRLGAGDALLAGIIDGCLDNDLAAGVRRGIMLAGIALTTVGDQVIISRAELDQALNPDPAKSRSVDR